MTKKRVFLQLLLILLVGLIPLLWFKDGSVILGHDSGLPFDPLIHFKDRLYLWSTHYGFGVDLNFGLVGSVLVIHGLETLLSVLGLSLQNVEKIEFIFWLTLPGLCMYYTAYKIWPQRKYLPLIAALLYMINYYIFQAWFAPERTKFSLYAAFPIFLYCMLGYFNGKIGWKKSILIAGITIGILNGGGSIPLYGGLIVASVIITLYANFINFSKECLKKTFIFFFGVACIYGLLNAYWIIPYIQYLSSSFSSALAGQGGPAGALGWTAYLSSGASFINLFRGQGTPDWYLNAYHPYAANYLNNPFLIIASFTFPLLAYSSLFIVKKTTDKYYIYIIALIGIIALIFASGPKSQLGFIYTGLALYMPGFAIFRSAYYKFDYVLWFSYAILIGYTLDVLFFWLEIKIKSLTLRKIFPLAAMGLIIILIVLYHYPILSGSFLDYSHEPGSALTTRIKVPQYVFDFGKWSNQQDINKRYVVLPELNEANGYISYKWGFWSLSTISSLLSRNSFIQNTSSLNEQEKVLFKELYKSLLANDMTTFNNISSMLGINDVVLQKDYDWDNKKWGTTNPIKYETALKTNKNFTLIKTFGEWQVYEINDIKSNRISTSSKLGFLQGDLQNIVAMPSFDPHAPIYTNGISSIDSSRLFTIATDIYISPVCNNCSLQNITSEFIPYNPSILPGSFLYPYVKSKEDKVKKTSTNFASLFNYYLTFSDRRVAESSWMLKSKQKLTFLPQTLDRYLVLLTGLKDLAEGKNWGVTSKDENDMSQSLIAHLLQQSSILESMYNDDLMQSESKIKLGNAYDLLAHLIDDAQKRVWVTKNTVEKLYSFDMSQAGTYQLYVKKSTLANPNDDTSGATISLRDNQKKVVPVGEVADWLNFGPINIQSGKNYLNFTDPTVKNLIDGIPPKLPTDTTGITINNGVYSLTTASQDKCFSIPITNLDTSDTSEYTISFKYRDLTDNKDLAFYLQDPGTSYSRLSVNDYFLSNNRNWTTHTLLVNPKYPTSSIFFCNGFSDLREQYTTQQEQNISSVTASTSAAQIVNNQPLAEVSDIALYKVSTPIVVLYQKRRNAPQIQPQVRYQRKSPVEYNVDMIASKEATFLTLNESYSPLWQLCSITSHCLSLTDSNHFISDGYANTWYLTKDASEIKKLYYTPQHLLIKSAIVNIVSIPFIIIFACWHLLWKKRR